MKYNNTHFLQLTRDLFTDEYKDLSTGAKWLFVVLNELEQRYTTGAEGSRGYFYRADADLAADAGISLTSLKRYKAELKNTDLIKTGLTHFVDRETGKKSEKKISAYKIMK